MSSRSQKTQVIEALFFERWDAATGMIADPLVTYADIRRFLPSGNVYAFFKDIVRNTVRANAIWPVRVLDQGYTGVQAVAEGGAFLFVPLPAGQTSAFVSFRSFAPSTQTLRHNIESASLPLASRLLGRGDEPWLIQVAVRLRLIETHLALFSPRVIVAVDHLQMSVKLQPAEVDALFLGVERLPSDELREVIISCEAKSLRDDIIEEQVRRQVITIARQRTITQSHILPLALKAIAPSEIYLVEFDLVASVSSAQLTSLQPVCEVIYTLQPTVPGIGL
jgi:hypothetical protein